MIFFENWSPRDNPLPAGALNRFANPLQSAMAKPLAELTLDDLFETTVWRIEDQRGVETALPTDLAELEASCEELLIVRSRFRLAGGASFTGFSTPGDWGGGELVSPVIIHEGRHLQVVDANHAGVADWLTLAGSPDEVFPVTVEPDVSVGGARVSRRYGNDGRDADAKRPGRLRRWLAGIDDILGRDDG